MDDRPTTWLRRSLILCFGLGLPLLYILWPWFSGRGLEVDRFRDDAYYQIVVARNLAAGRGFSFDGEHPASGVQALWTLVLAVPALCGAEESLPTWGYLLGLLLHFLTGALAWRILGRFFRPATATVLTLLYLSRPGLLLEVGNGQETALGLFFLFFWADSLFRGDRETGDPSGAPLRVGVATLLLPWARTDLLLFPLAHALWPHLASRFRLPAARPARGWVLFALSLGGLLAGNLFLFGAWLPPSGFAIPRLFHRNFEAGDPGLDRILEQYWWFFRPVLLGGPWALASTGFGLAASWLLLAPLARRRRFLPLLLTLAAALFGASDLGLPISASLLLALGPSPGLEDLRKRAGEVFLLGLLAFLGLCLLHLPVRWLPKDYYFVPLALPGLFGLGLLGEGFHAVRPGRPLPWLLLPPWWKDRLLLAALAGICLADLSPPGGRFPWQAEMALAGTETGRILREGVPRPWSADPWSHESPVLLGSFHSGLLAYESRLPVRNLDGVVDGASLKAFEEGHVLDAFVEEGGRFLVDSPRQLRLRDPDPHAGHASGRWMGNSRARFHPWVAFDLPGIGGDHEGTGAQILYALGEGMPLEAPRLLGARRGGVHVLLPTAWLLEGLQLVGGRRTGLPLPAPDPDARAAPYVVTSLPLEHGKVLRRGTAILEW